MSSSSRPLAGQDQWIVIQQKTFVNWANEQLIHSNRSVDNLATDLCDGVKLVALVEALQFRKIGKVYSKPASRIQMLHNVSLALEAIAEDNIKLVNIGTDDIVGGNVKLILGLLWRLIIRYQISSSKARSPPKKMMLSWLQNALGPLNISNFTSDWRSGIALHALLEFCKPGLSPNWRQLSPQDSVHNCRMAMQLAKDQLAVPKMITAEDFCSPDLDELSAMTYLSYFLRKNSPGYYATLNWVCKQLKTTTISNLTTDWNDGYYLCALVHSFGGEVKGWPHVDRRNHLATCQLGLDSAHKLGLDPMLTAAELADPNIDHLTLMVYLSQFKKVTPRTSNRERLVLDCSFSGVTVGNTTTFKIVAADKDCDKSRVRAWVTGPSVSRDCDITWDSRAASCRFQPAEAGHHQLHVCYDQQAVGGSPISFSVAPDFSKPKVTKDLNLGHFDQQGVEETDSSRFGPQSVQAIMTSPVDVTHPEVLQTASRLQTSFPSVDSTKRIDDVELVQVLVAGEGISRGTKGLDACFTVHKNGLAGEITAEVEVCGHRVPCSREVTSQEECAFSYVPTQAGIYQVHVYWQQRPVAGSPFSVPVIDRSRVTPLDDLTGRTDESGRLALDYGVRTELNFDVALAGPGAFKAEVLSPGGKLLVDVIQTAERVSVSFVTWHEGDHYIHLYWSQVPVECSPLHAYCPGPPLPIDATKVILEGSGAEAARATVPAEFLINGMRAGPGEPRIRMQGIHAELPVAMKALKYDRYLCRYTSHVPGSFLLYVYWSEELLPDCPVKIAVSSKGDVSKVKVSGEGLGGGISNNQLEIFVDTHEAGPGEVTVECHSPRHSARCDVKEEEEGYYTLRILPTEAEKHVLHIRYDGQQVPGSPFTLRIGEPPDPSKVRVFGPGIKHGLMDTFESSFLVDTHGAGAGQLAVKIRGPKGGFRVDMSRETKAERTIVCRYDPSEPGQYVISVRWSGEDVPGSPYLVHVVDSHHELMKLNHGLARPSEDITEDWRADI